jgi:iron complex transport system permease protein
VSTPRKAGTEAAHPPNAGKPATGPKARPARPQAGKARPAGKSGTTQQGGTAGKTPAARPTPTAPGPGLVIGPVPVLARVAGGTALAGAILLLVAQAFPLARSGGRDVGGAGNVLGFLPVLPLVAVVAAAGVLLLRGSLPRLGLAALLSAGTLAAGPGLRTLALLDDSARTTVDLPLGIATSARYEAAPGLVLLALGYGLLVLAAVLAAAAWPRTLMEDDGDFDPRRPRLAAWGLAVGGFSAIVVGMAPYASTTALVPPAVPERSGLELLGGLVLALGTLVWAVVAATLRPRLAVAGAYAGLAAVLLADGLAIALLVVRSPALQPSVGGVGTLLAGLAMLALAWVAAPVRGLPRRAG